MMTEPTFRERLVAIETDVRWIKDNMIAHKEMEKRVSRLERLGSWAAGVFAACMFYLKVTLGK